MSIKLHLGCFNKKIHGWVNVDIRPECEPDVVDDIATLSKFGKDSASIIYSSHTLEHLSRPQALQALARWYDVLEHGGILRLAVPNMERIFAHYFYHRDLQYCHSALHGSQRHPFDVHLTSWDENLLRNDLQSVGFKDVRWWDTFSKECEHFFVDDYSKAVHPHMTFSGDFELMSLNLEAEKY